MLEPRSHLKPLQCLPLWPERCSAGTGHAEDDFQPTLDCYPLEDGQPHPILVIFPGGGYSIRAQHEGVDIADRFRQLGCHAFVVQYRTAPYRFPEPQRDAFRAIRLVRQLADRWRMLSDRLAVCGFSAGGHLAACTGTIAAEVNADAGDAADAFDMTPNAMILGYPVISFGPNGHEGSGRNLLGDRLDAERERYSLENRVGPHTPPTFLWHTATDAGVPVENSLMFAAALRTHRRPWGLHVFPEGVHGLGLAPEHPDIAVWPELARDFLRDQCNFPL